MKRRHKHIDPPERTWDQLTPEEQNEIAAGFKNWLRADLVNMTWMRNPNGSWSGRDKNLLADVFSVPARRAVE